MASPNAIPLAGRFCEAGHLMDPTWEICPYCDAEKRSKEKTQLPQQLPLSAAGNDRKTTIGEVPSGVRRETKTMPPASPYGSSGPPHGGSGDTRRIMGILITYTWRPEGQLFTIREGKNFIGAENVSSEVSHRPCEIQIRTDPMLSAEHALILCRHGRYDLVDQRSSNGTFLNGELVPIQGIELREPYAEIKTGNTVWKFVKIEPPPATEAHPPHQTVVVEEVVEPPPEEPSKRPKGWTEVK